LRRQPSLRSQLNQIRLWVRQGRTDAWIAHKLDVSVDDLARFKREHALDADVDAESGRGRPADPLSVPPPEPRYTAEEEAEEYEDEEEDELERERERPRPRSRGRRRSRRPARAPEESEDEAPDDEELSAPVGPAAVASPEADGDEAPRRRRRRGRRGGRRHRGRRNAYEATFDHGDEGYGLWLDPAVADNPVYSEYWAGHRAVTVTVDAEAITIRRANAGGEPAPADDEED
jgi:hypothetical protein